MRPEAEGVSALCCGGGGALKTGLVQGQVVETAGGVYRVRTAEAGRVNASLRGRIKHRSSQDRVVIGDFVEVAPGEAGEGVIEKVLPRRTSLWRRSSRAHLAKVMAANLDTLLVVASVADPPPSRAVIDRMLVMGEAAGMACTLVLNKIELARGLAALETLGESYRRAQYPVLAVSAVTGEGMAALEALIRRGSSILVGPSGVGKSSLLNAIEPGLDLRTRTVGRRSRIGRHTTVSSRLIALAKGGWVADTPGVSDARPAEIRPAHLARCFADFRPWLGHCRFSDCLHLREPGCAVRRAVAEGHIEELRLESYRAILAELQEREL